MTEDEMVGWHHRLEGHEFELALGVVMDRETWRVVVHGVAKSRTWLSNCTELIDNMVVYLRNPREPAEKLLQTKEFNNEAAIVCL